MSDPVVESQTDFTPLRQYFGIEQPYDSGYGEDFEFILRWAGDRKMSTEDMKLELKKIEMRLGDPQPGENRWHRVKHYLSLNTKLDNTLREMASAEKGWEGMV
jgi:hypothetical protein